MISIYEKLNQLDFTDRESYIQWRAEWRQAYKELSQQIRSEKQDFKSWQRKIIIGKINDGRSYPIAQPLIDGKVLWAVKEYTKALMAPTYSKAFAQKMMEIRERSKEKACRLRNSEEYEDCQTVAMPKLPKVPKQEVIQETKVIGIEGDRKWRDRISTFLFGKI